MWGYHPRWAGDHQDPRKLVGQMSQKFFAIGLITLSVMVRGLAGLFFGGILSQIYIPPWVKENIYSSLPDIEENLVVAYEDSSNQEIQRDLILVQATSGGIPIHALLKRVQKIKTQAVSQSWDEHKQER